MLLIRIADSTKRAMADFAIAAEFTLFAQEEFADAFIASVEKVLVIYANFFMTVSPYVFGICEL